MALPVPDGAVVVAAPFLSTVWQLHVEPGSMVAAGERIAAVEAMKMESVVTAPCAGRVLDVYIRPGEQVAAGQAMVAIGAQA